MARKMKGTKDLDSEIGASSDGREMRRKPNREMAVKIDMVLLRLGGL